MSDPYERFTFQWPGIDVDIHACYNIMTGRLDLEPDIEASEHVTKEVWNKAVAFCHEHGINYFYLSEVRESLREAGVDPADLP